MACLNTSRAQMDDWIDHHFDEQVSFLKKLIQCPTDTPKGNNAPHAKLTASLLSDMGFSVEDYPVPEAIVAEAGLETITNLIVRRKYSTEGITIALNAHGDVVPPGEGWTHDPYGAEVVDGVMYGRATAVSKSDFSTYTFAVRALEAIAPPTTGSIELHFTYDEEVGGELGPEYLLRNGLTKPDFVIAAGFSYEVVTAHNGCLQLEVTVEGKMAHAAVPHTGVDALQGAVAIMNSLYAENSRFKSITSSVPGIKHPYLNVGTISGGTNTNVVPGKVTFRMDRRMIPEEDPIQVEREVRDLIASSVDKFNLNLHDGAEPLRVSIKKLLLANSLKPSPLNAPLVSAIQRHATDIFNYTPPAVGTPLYTDVRLYGEYGVPGVIYGAGPRTVLESHAKRADERLVLEDLRKATKVVARTLLDLLQ